MPAVQAEVVGEHMAIQLFTQLGTEHAATGTASQATEDGTGNCAESDANGAGDQANGRANLAASKCSTGTASCATGGTDGGTDFHGCAERGDLGGAAEGALQ